jgi:hypothetical protein
MRYLVALVVSITLSALLLFGLERLRGLVGDRIAFLNAQEQVAGAGEEVLLRIAFALGDYGYLLILPIFGVCFYLAKRSSRPRDPT